MTLTLASFSVVFAAVLLVLLTQSTVSSTESRRWELRGAPAELQLMLQAVPTLAQRPRQQTSAQSTAVLLLCLMLQEARRPAPRPRQQTSAQSTAVAILPRSSSVLHSSYILVCQCSAQTTLPHIQSLPIISKYLQFTKSLELDNAPAIYNSNTGCAVHRVCRKMLLY